MTDEQFNERIDRLTERHEALVQSVELTQHELHDLGGKISAITSAVASLVEVSRAHERNLETLVRIATRHENRSGGIEAG